MSIASFQAWVANTTLQIESCLAHYLIKVTYPARILQEAMAYAALDGGKRIRPLLVYATGKIFDAPVENLDLAAIGIELIHSYSLVHDDLPAMDNAASRRGKPSCFKAFGENIAILSGDALLTLAFEIFASHAAPLSAAKRVAMIQVLSHASGPSGMVSGQSLDISNTPNAHFSENALLQLYQLKTGALIQASIKLGWLASTVKSKTQQTALENYARYISLAFQIQDDILDMEGQEQYTGKSVGLDKTLQKRTYPVIVGLEPARQKAQSLFQQALLAIEPLGEKATFLFQLTEYMRKRKM